jgi:hypothetical protein
MHFQHMIGLWPTINTGVCIKNGGGSCHLQFNMSGTMALTSSLEELCCLVPSDGHMRLWDLKGLIS